MCSITGGSFLEKLDRLRKCLITCKDKIEKQVDTNISAEKLSELV